MILARFFRYVPTSIPLWIKYGVSLALLVLLLRHIDWRSVGDIMLRVNPWGLLAYALTIVLGNVISAYRWRILAGLQGFGSTLWQHVSWYITGTFINNFLPGFLGGDAYRAYMLGRTRSEAMGRSIFAILVDRATGLFGAVLVATVAGALWLITTPSAPVVAQTLFGGAVILCGTAFLGMRYRTQLITFMARRMPKRYTHYSEYAAPYTDAALWRSITLGVLFMLIGVGVANYILFVALGVIPGIVSFLFFAMIASVISAAPISIGNIGVKEWAYVTLFSIVGIAPALAVAVVIIGRIMQALLSCLGIPLYLMQDRATRTALHNKKALSA
jgi:uncharacterized membrane protein YbhN (UPF0104 family)